MRAIKLKCLFWNDVYLLVGYKRPSSSGRTIKRDSHFLSVPNRRIALLTSGKPDAPRTCMMVNRTSTAVQVNCEKGFDGGLPQEFTMELYSAARDGGSDGHRRIVSNITSRSKPEFVVTGLEPGAGYFVSVYSSNGKGRSATFTLSVSTLKSTHQEHRRTTGESNIVSLCLVIKCTRWFKYDRD